MFFQKQFWKCDEIKPPKQPSKKLRSSSRGRSKSKLLNWKNIKKRKSILKQKNTEQQLEQQSHEDQIVEDFVVSPEELSFIQLQTEIKQYRKEQMDRGEVTSKIEFYFRNFIKITKYQDVMKNIGVNAYNTISKYVLRKQFLPKIQGEMSKIVEVVKFKFQTKQLLVVVKNKNKGHIELQVTELDTATENKNKQGKLFNAKRIMPVTEYKRYSCIHNYLMVNFENKEICTIDEYLRNKADLNLLILVYRTRIKLQLKTYKYKSKFKLDYFYETHVIKNYPRKQIIFFAKVFINKGVLKLSVESISEPGVKFMVPVKVVNDNYQGVLEDFLDKNHVSLTRNRGMRKIDYYKLTPEIKKIQSVFKGFREFHSYQQYKLQHPEWCSTKSDPSHKQFITCITKQFYIVLAYQSQSRSSPHTFKYKLRYTQIINQQFSCISLLESQATFISMIGRINGRIETYEMNENSDYKKRLQKLKQVLFRFLFKYKNRRSARMNYHQTKRIDVDGEKVLVMARNSPKIAESYEICLYNLTRTNRYFSFTIRKDICSKYLEGREVERLFYLSYNHCILKPIRMRDRHYVLELREVVEEENVYFYEVYQEKRACFYLEVYKGNSCENYESVYKKEIPKKELAEMEVGEIEREVMEVVDKLGGMV